MKKVIFSIGIDFRSPKTEESGFMTCLFMILAYSLPQPPRHSWLPEEWELDCRINIRGKALQVSEEFFISLRNSPLEGFEAILSKCDC